MQIPEKGLPPEQIFATLNAIKTYDMNWKEGRMYAYVYDPGEAAMEIGRQAYLTYLVENGLDPTAFPSVLKLENEVVRMVIHLLRGDERVVGNFTTGGTESILLAVKTARDYARVHKPHIQEPEMVLCQTAHHAFHKAAQYFGLKVVMVPFDPNTFRLDVEAMRKAISPNTILLVASAPAYSQGVIDPIAEVGALAQEHDLLFHVDACVGGIHLSFMRQLGYDVPPFDWTVPGVTSISTDLHKFGYCPKQASVIMYRTPELRRFQIFTSTRTTCYTLINPTILSTRSGGPAAGAWAVLNFLGQQGYRKIVSAVQEATAQMIAGVETIADLRVMGKPDMCLFAFTSQAINLFQVVDAMAQRGWTVQPQFTKPNAPRNIHISVNYGNVRRVDDFLLALRQSVAEVSARPPLQSEPLIAELKRLIEEKSPNLFERAAALVGMENGNLPREMALVNTLLEAMPEEVQSQFLVEFFNQLYR